MPIHLSELSAGMASAGSLQVIVLPFTCNVLRRKPWLFLNSKTSAQKLALIQLKGKDTVYQSRPRKEFPAEGG